jgi:hypothetical protein
VESSHDESDREEKEQEDGKDESSGENGEWSLYTTATISSVFLDAAISSI